MQAYDTQTTAVPPPPFPSPAVRVARSRPQQFALFFACFAWYYCALSLAASAANGIAVRFDLNDAQPLLEAVFLLFLVVVGFAFLRSLERRRMPLRLTLGLPQRSTSRAEWALGAAIGWGLAVAAVLPLVLTRALNTRLWNTPRAFEATGLSLAILAILTLVEVLVFTGYPFQRFIEALGPTRATIWMMVLIAIGKVLFGSPPPSVSWTPVIFSVFGILLLMLAWHRTHGLWLAWGLNFAWNASIAILFGLPIGGSIAFSSVVESRPLASPWLGGLIGPEASILTPLFLLIAIPILIRATSDYAWSYTHPPIIPGGYDVTIPPPAAHVAMEQAALERADSQPLNPGSLVQILPATPSSSTTGSPTE